MTVSVVLVRVLMEAATQTGVPAERLLSVANFDARRLDDNAGRVSVAEYETLQSAAIELTGDEALGLHIGERSNFSGFDVAAGLVAFAANLRAALQTYLRFQRIFGEQPGSAVTESEDCAALRYEFPRGSAPYNRFRAELSIAGFMRLFHHFAGSQGKVRAVYFEHEAPSHVAEYTRIFGGAERFEQRFTGIDFPRAWLECGPSHTDPEFYSALEVLAKRRLVRLEGNAGVKARVVDCLAAAARDRGQRPDMAQVAKQLGMSARSLRRRLNAEGVTFAQACDEALTQLAKSMLSDPEQSIAAAAFALGFSDSSAFHRAFKRWTGITPKQYREQL